MRQTIFVTVMHWRRDIRKIGRN